MRASITRLCVADHRNRADILERWLANKTPQHVIRWMANRDNRMRVVTDAGIVCVGCVTVAGEINLNYVAPDARFRGASSLLLDALERAAVADGNAACSLESTATALSFYRRRGYVDAGPPGDTFGLTTYPLRKALVP